MSNGEHWYTRKNFPIEYLDVNTWPQVDLSDLPLQKRLAVENRQRAIRAYLAGHQLTLVCGECALSKAELLRHLNRCVAAHPDGRIYGWRALLPHQHIKPYMRFVSPSEASQGLAGAFQQFLRDHPLLKEQLDQAILTNKIAVLGYHIAITREPSAADVIQTVRNATTVCKHRDLSLPGQTYPEGALMPSAALPEAVGQCWNVLLLDNASIHCSNAVSQRLRKRLGCAINYGPVFQWYRRPLVEGLFSALERRGFLRLPNTTGTGPGDARRPVAAANATKHVMLLEEMLDLIDIVVCTYNGTARESLDGCSPLEHLSNAFLGAPTRWLPRTLPPLPPSVPDLDVVVEMKTIRGDLKTGRRPYVQIDGVRYTSPILSSAASLISTQLKVHICTSDLRTVKAFLPSGAELGVLTASSAWGRTRHDRMLRKHVLRAIHDKTLVVAPNQDPIQEYMVLKAQQALHDKARSKQSRISDSATALARAVQISEQSVPRITPGSEPPAVPPARPSREMPIPPSFVPRVHHRGVLK